jgi:hypothetical protein
MKNKFYLPAAVMMIISTALPFFALAQDPGGGPDVPIDGGLSLLVAAGAAYGVKKYREHKKKNSEDAGQDLK